MKIESLDLDGLQLLKPDLNKDNRGFFIEKI